MVFGNGKLGAAASHQKFDWPILPKQEKLPADASRQETERVEMPCLIGVMRDQARGGMLSGTGFIGRERLAPAKRSIGRSMERSGTR
jgi:hypothetical protein